MNVYIWTSGTLKNAYIGEVWTPGSNTLLYLPFTDDLNDHSSNQTSTKGWTVSIATLDWVKCANFNSGYLTFPSKKWFGTNSTFSLWVKNPSNPQESSIFCTSWVAWGWTEYVFNWRINNSPQSITLWTYGWWTWNPWVSVNYSVPSWWTNIVATMEWLVAKLYINWQLWWQVKMYYNNVTAGTLYIWNNTDEPTVSKWWLKAYLSELIIENTVWDATKVAHYYDITKWNYWIS